MLKKTKATILLTSTAVLVAGFIIAASGKTAAAQDNGSLLPSPSVEKLLYCETDSTQYSERHT